MIKNSTKKNYLLESGPKTKWKRKKNLAKQRRLSKLRLHLQSDSDTLHRDRCDLDEIKREIVEIISID